MATTYKEVLIECNNGDFITSVPSTVPDVGGRISSPREVFADGSQIIAVESGVAPTGSVANPNPFEIEEARRQSGGNGHEPQPQVEREGPRSGCFTVRYVNGGIELNGPNLPGLLISQT